MSYHDVDTLGDVMGRRFLRGSDYQHRVEASAASRQEIGLYLSRNGIRKRDYKLHRAEFFSSSTGAQDRYYFKKRADAVLLRLALNSDKAM